MVRNGDIKRAWSWLCGGGNYLYIAFQREHKIFRIKWDIVSQQIVDRIQVSEDGRFSHHPHCDVQANGRIKYVWEDSTADNIDIMRSWETYEGYQILSQTLGMSKYSHGLVTRLPYWPPPSEPQLTAIWTEGNQALVAQVFIYEYERKREEITKNTQELGLLPVNKAAIFIRPNPVHSVASISYSLPTNDQKRVNLKIYDAAGRLVRQFDQQGMGLSNQHTWDGTDDKGRKLPNGIYFLFLSTSDYYTSKKIVLMR